VGGIAGEFFPELWVLGGYADRASVQMANAHHDAAESNERRGRKTELVGTKIGRWPVPELPMKLSATPTHVGSVTNRGAPCYGEDNEYVLGELLGYPTSEIARLAAEEII